MGHLRILTRYFSFSHRIYPDGLCLQMGTIPFACSPDAPWTRMFKVGLDSMIAVIDFSEDRQGTRFGLAWKGRSHASDWPMLLLCTWATWPAWHPARKI